MKDRSLANHCFYISLVLAGWFMISSWMWPYFANVVFSFPAGILSFTIYRKGKKIDTSPERFALIAVMLIGGVILSASSLIYFKYFCH